MSRNLLKAARTHFRPDIAEMFREAREDRNMSQGEVARALRVHRPTITAIENGKRGVSFAEAIVFASLYQCSLARLTPPVLDVQCTGLTASWCPVHGDCTCEDRNVAMDDWDCPLHGEASDHAEANGGNIG